MYGSEYLDESYAIGSHYNYVCCYDAFSEKKEQELRNSIKIGDEITTIGGIVGTVISVKDESFVIKSQSESIRIKKWSVAAVNKAE